jgi:predicted permease
MLITGQALDALTFTAFFLVVPAAIIAELGKAERNPIVATLFALGGFGAVLGVKLGITAWVVWRDRRRLAVRPRKTAFFLFIAGASGFIGAAFNLYALRTVLEVLG